MSGVNAKDNVVRLTIAQHAEAHLMLYELFNNENDLLAHRACIGMLSKRKPTHIFRPKKKHKLHKKLHNKRNKYRNYSI